MVQEIRSLAIFFKLGAEGVLYAVLYGTSITYIGV